MKKRKSISLIQLLVLAAIVVALNILVSGVYWRLDLTENKRYTISEPTRQVLNQVDDKLYLRIFLTGELPAEYRRLKGAISDMLDEYNAYAESKVTYEFYNPFEAGDKEAVNKELKAISEKGVIPRPIARQEMGELSQKMLLPGAIAHYKGREVAINFLPENKDLNENAIEVVNEGINTLEFKLSNAIKKLLESRQKNIVFLQGHRELRQSEVVDMANTLDREQFDIQFLNLKNNVAIPPLTDVVIIPKPRQSFADRDKFKIDQYIMNGGRVLWLLDGMKASLDSFSQGNRFAALDLPLNLDDQLFHYGVRINKDLVLDKQCNPLPLFSEDGKMRNFYPWYFYPVIYPQTNHPIVKHLDPVMMRFASSMDTIKVPDVRHTVLLSTSKESTAWKSPVMVRLDLARNPPMDQQFGMENLPVAVLLEGEFKSLYQNRVPQNFLRTYEDSLGMRFKEKSSENKMIVVSDGDIIRNGFNQEGEVQPLGQYQFNPRAVFSNKIFLMNCISYLTDDFGLIATRSKDFKVRPLDQETLRSNQLKWQVINLAVPVGFILLFAGVYNFIRRRKYRGSV